MSDEAKEFIRQALQSYQFGDGASLVGSCRDLVTDLIHEMMGNKEILKRMKKHYGTPLIVKNEDDLSAIESIIRNSILLNAWGAYKEEIENAEWKEINDTPKKDLPLLLMHEWVFETSQALYEERLKDIKDK